MHVILIPKFNKLLLWQKQMTKYTLDIFKSPFVTQQSNVRNILNIFIGHFQSIKTDVLQIFSFITGDKTEFLSPMMFSN